MTASSSMPTTGPLLRAATVAVSATALLSACSSPGPSSRSTAERAERESGTVAAPHAEPVSLEDWTSESFALPPGFAPTLPTGRESLRFSPGWRTPSSEGFWSYAFIMWIDEPVPSATRLCELVKAYYTGLMAAFTEGSGRDTGAAPVTLELQRTSPNRYEGRMRLIDAFATFEPIDLRLVIDSVAQADARSALAVRISPQPKEHRIWRSLEAAIADIRVQGPAAPPPAPAP